MNINGKLVNGKSEKKGWMATKREYITKTLDIRARDPGDQWMADLEGVSNKTLDIGLRDPETKILSTFVSFKKFKALVVRLTNLKLRQIFLFVLKLFIADKSLYGLSYKLF